MSIEGASSLMAGYILDVHQVSWLDIYIGCASSLIAEYILEVHQVSWLDIYWRCIKYYGWIYGSCINIMMIYVLICICL